MLEEEKKKKEKKKEQKSLISHSHMCQCGALAGDLGYCGAVVILARPKSLMRWRTTNEYHNSLIIMLDLITLIGRHLLELRLV